MANSPFVGSSPAQQLGDTINTFNSQFLPMLGAEMDRRYQEQQAEKQRKWIEEQTAKQNAYNNPSAQMARLIQAGVHPAAAQQAILGVSPQAAASPQMYTPPTSSYESAFTSSVGSALDVRAMDIQDINTNRELDQQQAVNDAVVQRYLQQIKLDAQQYDFNEQMNDLRLTYQRIINDGGQTSNAYNHASLNVFLHANGLQQNGDLSPESAQLFAEKFKKEMEQSINSATYDSATKAKMINDIDRWYTLLLDKQYAELRELIAKGNLEAVSAHISEYTQAQKEALPQILQDADAFGEAIAYIASVERGNDETAHEFASEQSKYQFMTGSGSDEIEISADAYANFKLIAGKKYGGELATRVGGHFKLRGALARAYNEYMTYGTIDGKKPEKPKKKPKRKNQGKEAQKKYDQLVRHRGGANNVFVPHR